MNPAQAQARIDEIRLFQAKHQTRVPRLIHIIKNNQGTPKGQQASDTLNQANEAMEACQEERNHLESIVKAHVAQSRATDAHHAAIRQIVCALITDPEHSTNQEDLVNEAMEIIQTILDLA